LRKGKVEIAPSLLSADFANLANDIKRCETAGVDYLHVDVMDGAFVPNITIGPLIVQAIRPITKIPIDCHLMIENPDKYIPAFAEAGADMISAHVEATAHLHRTLGFIKSFNCKAGAVLNPITPMEFAYSAAEYCDFILLMSVNPGFGGQAFIDSYLRRCSELRNFLDKEGLNHVAIEVDGGVKIENARLVAEAGTDIIVSGSGLFAGDFVANVAKMREELNSITFA